MVDPSVHPFREPNLQHRQGIQISYDVVNGLLAKYREVKSVMLKLQVQDAPTLFRYKSMEIREPGVYHVVRASKEAFNDVFIWFQRRAPITRAGTLGMFPEL
jgi:hypothetical protein